MIATAAMTTKERFDRIELLLDKLYEKLEQKADK